MASFTAHVEGCMAAAFGGNIQSLRVTIQAKVLFLIA
jgi:hypothetical protein